MHLYLIRHGLAGQHGDWSNDRERPLTEEGKRKTRLVAQRLAALELTLDLILTSPLVRARQTAEILQAEGLGRALEIVEYLSPEGEMQDWLDWLDAWRSPDKTVGLVGHEPNLSSWAEQLMFGKAVGSLTLKKAGVIGLVLPDTGSPLASSQLFWLTPPRLLLNQSKS
jgi:phosphohistidine phosphatase